MRRWNSLTLSSPPSSVILLILAFLVAKAKCHCLGTKHPVLFNCTECGNIICKEEELEVCTYCGAFSQNYRRKYRNEKEEEALRKAIENKVGFTETISGIEPLASV